MQVHNQAHHLNAFEQHHSSMTPKIDFSYNQGLSHTLKKTNLNQNYDFNQSRKSTMHFEFGKPDNINERDKTIIREEL